jgi:hypothetical protein
MTNNNSSSGIQQREEIEMLLPWYVTGKLGGADAAKVSAYLAEHEDMALQMELIREERGETLDAHARLASPSPQALDRLMASVAEAEKRTLRWQSLWQPVAEFFTAPAPGTVRWVSAAAAVVMVLQAVLIITLSVHGGSGEQTAANPPQTGIRTASGRDVHEGGVAVLAVFNDNATAAEITRFLNENNAVITGGPETGGFYKLKAGAKGADAKEVMRRMSENRGVVKLVLPGKL